MKLSSIIVTLLAFQMTFAQQVDVLRTGEGLTKSKKNEHFYFIHEYIDTSKLVFVATIKASFNDATTGVENLFVAIKNKANKLHANCFRPHSFLRNDSARSLTLTLDTYFASDEVVEENQSKRTKNLICIFSGEKTEQNALQTVVVNGSTIKLPANSYFTYPIKEGETVHVKKSGIESATKKITWNNKQMPVYLILWGGFAVSDYQPVRINMLMSGGYINHLDTEFGELLKLLSEPIN
jgi:hypothetical protein